MLGQLFRLLRTTLKLVSHRLRQGILDVILAARKFVEFLARLVNLATELFFDDVTIGELFAQLGHVVGQISTRILCRRRLKIFEFFDTSLKALLHLAHLRVEIRRVRSVARLEFVDESFELCFFCGALRLNFRNGSNQTFIRFASNLIDFLAGGSLFLAQLGRAIDSLRVKLCQNFRLRRLAFVKLCDRLSHTLLRLRDSRIGFIARLFESFRVRFVGRSERDAMRFFQRLELGVDIRLCCVGRKALELGSVSLLEVCNPPLERYLRLSDCVIHLLTRCNFCCSKLGLVRHELAAGGAAAISLLHLRVHQRFQRTTLARGASQSVVVLGLEDLHLGFGFDFELSHCRHELSFRDE